MKVLVTGGSGVVGEAAVTELVRRSHSVRLLSRNAEKDAELWPTGVESWPASISEPDQLKGSAEGCDLVLHVAGIVAEDLPQITFESVNVDGTRTVMKEAERANVGRFIYVSSLGAETGQSPYHRSKRRAEEIVRNFAGGWMILRPGNVYGPGDELISLLLTMVRTLPVVPVIGNGDDKFQPIWVGDLAETIAQAVERTDLHGRVLDLAGNDITSASDLVKRFSELTGRSPAQLPVPAFLASAGAALAGLVGAKLPINEGQLTMLSEENVIRTPGGNALTGVFNITPVPLESGLRKLADVQPEQTPDKGVGTLKRKRFWAEISGSRLSHDKLFEQLRLKFSELTPMHVDVRAEPGAPTVINEGTTLTMALPLRGNVQVRCQELTECKATLVTLAGHPLAGAVRLLTEQRGDLVRFEVQVYDRPANIADWVAMRAVGGGLQAQTWESLVDAMVKESGGVATAPVQHEETNLDDDEADRIDEWLKELIMARKRAETGRSTSPYMESATAERPVAEATM